MPSVIRVFPAANAEDHGPALVAVVADTEVKACRYLVGILDPLTVNGAGVLDEEGGKTLDRHGSPAEVRVCGGLAEACWALF